MHTHIQIPDELKVNRAIVCGSPERAQWIATFLDEAREVAKNREFHSYYGKYDGSDILVISHGIGASGATICFYELIKHGIEFIIRIGTAGSYYDGAQVGDIILVEGAICDEGTSHLMVPAGYPAFSDSELTSSMQTNFEQNQTTFRKGVVHTCDLFYPGVMGSPFDNAVKAGALAVEMEMSALLSISRINQIKATGALVIAGEALVENDPNHDPRPETLEASMHKVVVAAFQSLAKL